MDSTFLVLSLLLFAAAIVSLIIFVVKIIAKKKTATGIIALCSAIAGVVFFTVSICVTDLSMGLTLGAFLAALTAVVSIIVFNIKWFSIYGFKIRFLSAILKDKRISKPFIIGACSILLCILFGSLSSSATKAALLNPVNYEIVTKTTYDFEVVDGTEPIEIVSSTGFNTYSGYSSRYHRVYECSDNYLVFDKTDATVDDCLEVIKMNTDLGKRYKDFFTDFINRIGEKYPDADLTMLYHNLATLKVIELDKMDYFSKSFSVDSYGCYRMDENIIYIPEGTEFKEGTWGFQVLIHEFCHAVRTARWEEDGVINWAAFNMSGEDKTLLMEAMNSVFSCSLLSYNERDIAYQVPSNYLRIMLECMDNYTLSDYINHGDTYFLSKLDEFMGNTNYAEVIWKLIAVQRSDYQDENMMIPAEKYYPIYDYICEMYYDKYITDEMTAEERKVVADKLVDKAFFDAPDEYTISPEYFYTYLDSYVGNTADE